MIFAARSWHLHSSWFQALASSLSSSFKSLFMHFADVKTMQSTAQTILSHRDLCRLYNPSLTTPTPRLMEHHILSLSRTSIRELPSECSISSLQTWSILPCRAHSRPNTLVSLTQVIANVKVRASPKSAMLGVAHNESDVGSGGLAWC